MIRKGKNLPRPVKNNLITSRPTLLFYNLYLMSTICVIGLNTLDSCLQNCIEFITGPNFDCNFGVPSFSTSSLVVVLITAFLQICTKFKKTICSQ